jgi:hypothetical protein
MKPQMFATRHAKENNMMTILKLATKVATKKTVFWVGLEAEMNTAVLQ